MVDQDYPSSWLIEEKMTEGSSWDSLLAFELLLRV